MTLFPFNLYKKHHVYFETLICMIRHCPVKLLYTKSTKIQTNRLPVKHKCCHSRAYDNGQSSDIFRPTLAFD